MKDGQDKGVVPVVMPKGVSRVELSGGGFVHVRRLRRSTDGDLNLAANVHVGPEGVKKGALDRLEELTIRWAIVHGEKIVDEASREAVNFGLEHHAGLGPIAGRDVYDALSDDDLKAIRAATERLPVQLSEAQAGN